MQDLSARGVGPRGLAGQGAQVGTTIAAPAAAQNVVDIFGTATDTERLGIITLQEETGGGVRFTPDIGAILPSGSPTAFMPTTPAGTRGPKGTVTSATCRG